MWCTCKAVGHINFPFADRPQQNAHDTLLGILSYSVVVINNTQQHQGVHCDCFWRRHQAVFSGILSSEDWGPRKTIRSTCELKSTNYRIVYVDVGFLFFADHRRNTPISQTSRAKFPNSDTGVGASDPCFLREICSMMCRFCVIDSRAPLSFAIGLSRFLAAVWRGCLWQGASGRAHAKEYRSLRKS